MADKKLQDKVDDILSAQGHGQPSPPQGAMAKGELAELPPPRPLFSAFVDEHVEKATAMATEFMEIADKQGLEEAVKAIQAALQNEQIAGLVQYAVKLFLTHHPEARSRIKLQPLEVRQPNLVAPSKPVTLEAPARGKAALSAAEGEEGGATPPEDKLSFWREDPLINEHHEHWHLVYPTRPVPFPSGAKPPEGYALGDRHGELFAYMHEQMIARYDTERISAGLERVEPFDVKPLTSKGFTMPIPQGYDPGDLRLWDGSEWYQFRPRPANATISDLTLNEAPNGPDWSKRPGAKIDTQAKFGNEMFAADETGNYDLIGPSNPVKIDNLGNTVEANANSVDFYGNQDPRNFGLYGNFHNDGHIHFMLFDNTAPYGVMAQTSTAVRDPIFFRWHKLIDEIYYQYQQVQLKPYDFSNGPAVKIRKSHKVKGKAASIDIILCHESGLPASIDGRKFGSRGYNDRAAAAFGHTKDAKTNNWNGDFSSGKVKLPTGETITTTDELVTEMLTRTLNLVDAEGNPQEVTIDYLAHKDFYYFIRVQNRLDTSQTVAARVFLVAETELEDRRMWIEMDRFAYRLKPSERAVLLRAADQSSVIRKPALKPDDLTAADGASEAREAQPWCDCGWPYTLLLPRGTKKGMDFRLLVMFSSGDDLTMPDHPDCCTSISYCGLQNLVYPDKTAMGYPFDRKFNGTIEATVKKFDNWAWRSIKVRCRNP
ncbi:MAG: tyrosinase family protein [Pyrinomonadaceae bacterium]